MWKPLRKFDFTSHPDYNGVSTWYTDGAFEWEDPDDELTSDVSAQETLMFGPGYQIQEEQRNFNIGGHVIKDLGIPLKYGVGK